MQHAVIFDMDGVLVDSYQAHLKSWQDVAESRGHVIKAEAFHHSFGRTSREIIHTFFGRDFSDEQLQEIDDTKEQMYRDMIADDFPAMPGVHELVASLRQAGFRTAIGSSGPPGNVNLALDKLGAGLFDAAIHGLDVTRGKPDPQVFQLAAERIDMPPHLCAVIEDAPPGIEAARAAGMAAIGFASPGRTVQELHDAKAHHVVQSLSQLTPGLISELIQQHATG